jgi:GNAT superfamily N-acetyltransferase
VREGAFSIASGRELFEDFAGVKRLYVRKHERWLGIAQAVLARWRRRLAVLPLGVLRLETCDRQVAVMRFYGAVVFVSVGRSATTLRRRPRTSPRGSSARNTSLEAPLGEDWHECVA